MLKSTLYIGYLVCKDVDLAATKKEQQMGLMFVKEPKMLVFVYKEPRIRKFWMKNTLMDLDIIFCFENKVIDIMHGKALDEEHIGPDVPVDLVIETPFGFCDKYNIRKGSVAKLKSDK